MYFVAFPRCSLHHHHNNNNNNRGTADALCNDAPGVHELTCEMNNTKQNSIHFTK